MSAEAGLLFRSQDEVSITWLTCAQLEQEFPELKVHAAPGVLVTVTLPEGDETQMLAIAAKARELGLEPMCMGLVRGS